MRHEVVKHGIDIGDLVKMKRGYSEPGLVLDIQDRNTGVWVRVLWPDYGPGLEKGRDLEVISESR
jgi:hypothetical protein